MSLSRLLRLLGVLLTAVTTTLVVRVAADEWRVWRRADDSARAIAWLRLGLLATEQMSRERGPTNARLGEDDGPPDAAKLQALAEARQRTDAALAALSQLLRAQPPGPLADAAAQVDTAARALAQARAGADETIALPHAQRSADRVRASVYGLVATVPLLAPVNSALAQAVRRARPALDGEVQALRLTADLREHAGLLGSQFTAALVRGVPFTRDERLAVEQTRGRIAALESLITQRLDAADTPEDIRQAWAAVQRDYFDQAARQVVAPVIAAGASDGRYRVTAAQFAARYVPALQKVIGLRDALLARLQAQVAQDRRAAQRSLAVVGAASATLVAVLAVALVTLRRRVLQPLAQTTLALQALARNDLEAPLPRVRGDEEGAAVVQAVRALQAHTRARQALERERDGLIEQLQRQSRTDFLTGLPNRRAFFEAATARIAQARRHGFAVAVLLLDVDAFKAFNDRAGHSAGDEALRSVAAALRTTLRAEDLAARHGGEEFVVLLGPGHAAQGALTAERIRQAIECAPVALPGGGTAALTASVGVAGSDDFGLDMDLLLSQAGAALYRAKRAGRNRVVVAGPPEGASPRAKPLPPASPLATQTAPL